MILFCLAIFPKASFVNLGKSQYKKGDYSAAYSTFAGLTKLDDESQQMYDASAMIMRLARKYDSYNEFMSRGKKLEALDSLIQGIGLYNYLLPDAREMGVDFLMTDTYNKILSALTDDFGVSIDSANEILNEPNKIQYTLKLMDIVDPDWKYNTALQLDAKAAEAARSAQKKAKTEQRAAEKANQLGFDYDPDPNAFEEKMSSEEAEDEGETESQEGTPESDDGAVLYEFNVIKGSDGTYSQQ